MLTLSDDWWDDDAIDHNDEWLSVNVLMFNMMNDKLTLTWWMMSD